MAWTAKINQKKQARASYPPNPGKPNFQNVSQGFTSPRDVGIVLPQSRFDFEQLSRKKRLGEESTDAIINDHISVVFYCGRDNEGLEFLLRETENGYMFFETPTPGLLDPWRVPLERYLKMVLPQVTVDLPGVVIRLDRWAVPGLERMVTHSTCAVKVSKEQREILGQLQGASWFQYVSIQDLQDQHRLFSPDVLQTLHRVKNTGLSSQSVIGIELSYMESFFGLDPKTGKTSGSGLEMLINAAKLGRNEQEILYVEFLKMSVPYLTLGFKKFTNFMKKLGWSDGECKNLFRTFDMQKKMGLSYRDFLCGIAATEPVIQHGGPPAEIRCRYIFKFYDLDEDGKLSFSEFKSMWRDIRKSRNLPDDPVALEEEARKQAKLFGEEAKHSLGLGEFLTSVGQLRFRGTSHLLRSSTSIMKVISHREAVAGLKEPKQSDAKRLRTSADFSTLDPAEEESALGGFTRLEVNDYDNYEIANHSVRVRKSGTILDVHSIWDIEHSGFFGKKPASTRKNAFGSNASKSRSVFNFNQNEQAKEMLNALKYFENPLSGNHSKPAYNWGQVDRAALGTCLITICGLVKDVLANEPRLVELSSPVYILGDIHGNFPDLVSFEKALWRLGPVLTPASFLFLGDYVDRGDFGLEVIAYLFSHKLTAPSKFTLLRGNHEIREVQEMFTFYNECIVKFGEKIGYEVWSAVNEVFDRMPLAATIDNKVFCVHGGIPPPWVGNGLASIIKSIPVPLPKPETQSELAWDLMWSDPLHLASLSPEEKQQLEFVDGFALNLRRGTAHVFTEEALDAFLKRNGFSHVVRAHEVQQAGFHVQFEEKLLTVFSSSNYCGGSNEAACILADKLKLRMIRLDTT